MTQHVRNLQRALQKPMGRLLSSPPSEQMKYHSDLSMECACMQRSPACQIFSIHISARIEERQDALSVPVRCGKHERTRSHNRSSCLIRMMALVQEKQGRVRIPSSRSV